MQNASASSPHGYCGASKPDSQGLCSHCLRLERMTATLERTAAAMERLADLLPQLIANQHMMFEAMSDDQEEDTQPAYYLDGTPR